jgi:hypothetical protein
MERKGRVVKITDPCLTYYGERVYVYPSGHISANQCSNMFAFSGSGLFKKKGFEKFVVDDPNITNGVVFENTRGTGGARKFVRLSDLEEIMRMLETYDEYDIQNALKMFGLVPKIMLPTREVVPQPPPKKRSRERYEDDADVVLSSDSSSIPPTLAPPPAAGFIYLLAQEFFKRYPEEAKQVIATQLK